MTFLCLSLQTRVSGFGSDCSCGRPSLFARPRSLQGLQHIAGEPPAWAEEHCLACHGWMSHFHLLLTSSICHLAFNWLWEVEACTQPCFRRMTWTCQTADKAKDLSKSELGENTPPHPSKFAFIPVVRTAHARVSVPSSIILLGGYFCLEVLSPALRGCVKCAGIFARNREGSKRPLPVMEGKDTACHARWKSTCSC